MKLSFISFVSLALFLFALPSTAAPVPTRKSLLRRNVLQDFAVNTRTFDSGNILPSRTVGPDAEIVARDDPPPGGDAGSPPPGGDGGAPPPGGDAPPPGGDGGAPPPGGDAPPPGGDGGAPPPGGDAPPPGGDGGAPPPGGDGSAPPPGGDGGAPPPGGDGAPPPGGDGSAPPPTPGAQPAGPVDPDVESMMSWAVGLYGTQVTQCGGNNPPPDQFAQSLRGWVTNQENATGGMISIDARAKQDRANAGSDVLAMNVAMEVYVTGVNSEWKSPRVQSIGTAKPCTLVAAAAK